MGRVIILDDSPESMLQDFIYLDGELEIIERHHGPGPHPGTGTSQDVHAGDGADKPVPDWPVERVFGKIEGWEDRQKPGVGIPERGLIVTGNREYRVFEGRTNSLRIPGFWLEKITENESFKVLTHTHPNDVPPSAEDLGAAMIMDLDEIRAVTPNAIHRVVLQRGIPEDRQHRLFARIGAAIYNAISGSERERYDAEQGGMNSYNAVAVYAGPEIEDAWAEMAQEFDEIELYERIER